MPAHAVAPFRHADGTPWSWAEVARGLLNLAECRERLTASILEPGFEAVFWETVPSTSPGEEPYEQVVIDAPGLARVSPDQRSFEDHLTSTGSIVTFGNLGGDAHLVVPTPGPNGEPYPHLAAFLRTAPSGQVHDLWRCMGSALQEHWARNPDRVWVSTAGMGVYWLHIRLDSKPKYYRHRPFRDWQ